MKSFLFSIIAVSATFLMSYDEALSKKNLLDYDSERAYKRGTYLIVLSNPDLYNYFENYTLSQFSWRFIELKKTQGFDVDVISFREGNDDGLVGINGTNAQDLKDYLIEYYSNNPMLEYVLLVGDENQSNDDYNIPTFIIPSYNEGGDYDQTDYPYTFWGDDTGQNGLDAYDPKFFIGRWSIANLGELANIIVRNCNYADLSLAGLDYYDSSKLNDALVVAGSFSDAPEPSGWPVTPLWTTKWVKEELFEYGYNNISEALYYYDSETGSVVDNTNSNIISALGSGVGVVNYRGWGDATGWHKPDFHLDDIEGLNSSIEMPVVFSFVCNTGDFGNETQPKCFGEYLLTAGSALQPKGAVAVIGPSDLDTDTRFNNVLCGAMWDGLLEHKVDELAPALHYGKQAVHHEFEGLIATDNFTNIPYFYHHVYGSLGDPSLSVWLGEPAEMSSEFDNASDLGHDYISIIVTDSNGNPLIDVVGVVMKDGEIIGKSLSNQDGYLDIDLSGLEISSSVKLYLNKSQFRQKKYDIVFETDDNSSFVQHSYIPEDISIPDYGYTFTDSNSDSPNKPDYNWIEINPEEQVYLGENLGLVDDSSTLTSIGFDFRFYGQDFNQMTVGSNGWASFLPCLDGNDDGECEVIDHFYNNSITAPIGPYGLLAPFYDDLDDNGGTEPFNVFVYQDTEFNRFVIQWDNLANGQWDEICVLGNDESCPKETFQLILFDPAYYPTSTGEGIIKFQYKKAYNVDDHGCTIGIESPDKDQGVEYVFNKTYHPNASQWDALDESLGWGSDGLYVEQLAIEFISGDLLFLGDANLDSNINILDLIIIVNHIIGNSLVSNTSILDYNQDSFIDILDVTSIISDIIQGD